MPPEVHDMRIVLLGEERDELRHHIQHRDRTLPTLTLLPEVGDQAWTMPKSEASS